MMLNCLRIALFFFKIAANAIYIVYFVVLSCYIMFDDTTTLA